MIRDLKINMAQCGEDDIFEDNVMMVKYIPIHKTEKAQNRKQEENENEPINGKRNSEVEAVVDQVFTPEVFLDLNFSKISLYSSFNVS